MNCWSVCSPRLQVVTCLAQLGRYECEVYNSHKSLNAIRKTVIAQGSLDSASKHPISISDKPSFYTFGLPGNRVYTMITRSPSESLDQSNSQTGTNLSLPGVTTGGPLHRLYTTSTQRCRLYRSLCTRFHSYCHPVSLTSLAPFLILGEAQNSPLSHPRPRCRPPAAWA